MGSTFSHPLPQPHQSCVTKCRLGLGGGPRGAPLSCRQLLSPKTRSELGSPGQGRSGRRAWGRWQNPSRCRSHVRNIPPRPDIRPHSGNPEIPETPLCVPRALVLPPLPLPAARLAGLRLVSWGSPRLSDSSSTWAAGRVRVPAGQNAASPCACWAQLCRGSPLSLKTGSSRGWGMFGLFLPSTPAPPRWGRLSGSGDTGAVPGPRWSRASPVTLPSGADPWASARPDGPARGLAPPASASCSSPGCFRRPSSLISSFTQKPVPDSQT